MADPRTSLRDVFPAASPQDWRAAADALLKGAPFDKVMLTPTPEEITLQPIYRREVLDGLPHAATLPGSDGCVRGAHAAGYLRHAWGIAQELPTGEPAAFNAAILADLARGQTDLNLLLDIATLHGRDPDAAAVGEVGACGLSLAHLPDLARAFKDIVPDAVGWHFQSGVAGLTVAALFFAWLRDRGADPAAVCGSFNMDPLALLAAEGTLPTSIDQAFDELAALAAHCTRHAPAMRAAGVSTLPLHGAGGSAVHDLSFAMAAGLLVLRRLTASGLTIDEAARQVRFTFPIGGDFFMEVAKLRAARLLWSRVVSESGGSAGAARMHLHGRTGLLNKTRHDAHVNMLRTTTEALAGAVGGVDTLHVAAYDEVLREPSAFSRRIARNTQVILQEECELTHTIDPAGGSWFVESLTDDLARRAWDNFQAIEKEGGALDVLGSGWLLEQIAATRAGRDKGLAQRRVSLVGTNKYPDPAEKLPVPTPPDYAALRQKRAREVAEHRISGEEESDTAVLRQMEALAKAAPADILSALIEAATHGATVGEMTAALRRSADDPPTAAPLPFKRLATPYEELRQAAAAYADEHGHPPKIHLATLGALRRHKLRADFTRGFFSAGGFEITADAGADDPAEAASRAAASGARIVVICGTDDDYVEGVPALAAALKQAKPDVHLVVAGHPGEHEAAWRETGLDDYIFVKSDNLGANRRFLELVGALPASA